MRHATRIALRFLVLVLLYLAGAWLATQFIGGEDEVALFWPSSGLAFAIVVRYGLRWVLFVPVANLLLHLLIAPVPDVFMPYSIASNAIGSLVGGWLARQVPRNRRFTLFGGIGMLPGVVSMGAIGSLIGVTGMLHSGMIQPTQYWPNVFTWFMGDVLGIVCIAPLVLVVTAQQVAHPDLPTRGDFAGRQEKGAWILLLSLSFACVLWGAGYGSPYGLGLTALPLALLVWSAARFQAIWTVLGTTSSLLVLTWMMGLGIAGFERPEEAIDSAILLVFLSVIAVMPIMLSAVAYERRVSGRKLLRRATTDSATGLPNRAAFEDRLRNLLNEPPSQVQTLAYIDLDNIKLINDTASHAAGDALIEGLAGALRSSLRAGEYLSRIGGDDFALLMPEHGAAAERRGTELLAAVENYRTGWEGRALATTASIGMVTVRPGIDSFASLLSQADTACYTAKEMGGNRVYHASSDPDRIEERTQSMRWALRIREALDFSRFELFCQQIAPITAAGEEGLRYELLIRLRDGNGGWLSPAEFIPAAERYRLGTALDRHVVELALDWLERHPWAAARTRSCAINLTAASLVDEQFRAFLLQRVRRSAMPSERLCFEITETSAVRDIARAQRFIGEMRGLGCRFALDDFGTGFTSFSYLRMLPVDYLKIDGSFVRELEDSPLAQAVVRSMTDIARVMKMQVVAEHAENSAIVEHLRKLGVDYGQGYGLHRPEPLERFFGPEGVDKAA
jgi:diguanylate cyclase (GGDEF)-like protein